MGLSRLTAYEIAGNSDDIIATFGGPDKKTGKFLGWITRGPGHNYKLLFNTNPVYDSAEEAKGAMQTLIETIKDWVAQDLKKPDNPLKEFLNP